MIDHKCPYAALIGRQPKWQADDETGYEVCMWCHEPKYTVTKPKARVTTRKKEVA